MPNMAQVSTFFVQDSPITKIMLVFLCVTVYRLFVLNFWWCILRNIVNIRYRQVNSALFFNSCYFHNVGFPLWYAPAVPPKWGAQRKFGGTLKKIRRFAPEFAPPTSKQCRRL